MKILKNGKNCNRIYKFICDKCECVFECEENECKKEFLFSPDIYYLTYRCPNCKTPCYAKAKRSI